MFMNLTWRKSCPAILAGHDVSNAHWLHAFLLDLSKSVAFVSLGTMVERLRSGDAASKPALALTFDDGYKSIRTIVEPVCRELNIPFTTFVCTDVMDGGKALWYDRVSHIVSIVGADKAWAHWSLPGFRISRSRDLVSALKEFKIDEIIDRLDEIERKYQIDSACIRQRYMSRDDLAAVSANPLATIGAHTHRHPILSGLTSSEQTDEISTCIDELSSFGKPVRYFAYPNGKPEDYGTRTVDILKELGIEAAVTTDEKPLRFVEDLMKLPRLGFSQGDSSRRIVIKWTLPWYSLGEQRERRIRRQVRRVRSAMYRTSI